MENAFDMARMQKKTWEDAPGKNDAWHLLLTTHLHEKTGVNKRGALYTQGDFRVIEEASE